MRLVEPGGTLVQASCSSRVTGDAFHTTVIGRGPRRGSPLVVFARTGHPLDHPIGFPEGAYLKAVFAHVDPDCRASPTLPQSDRNCRPEARVGRMRRMAAPKFAPVAPLDHARGYESPDHVPDTWRADRPAEVQGRQPSGARLGFQGPDQGYAITLAARLRPRCTSSRRVGRRRRRRLHGDRACGGRRCTGGRP